MGILRDIMNILKAPTNSYQRVPLSDEDTLLKWLGVDSSNTDAINEATYFTCMKMLSETIGKLPLHYYQKTERGRVKAEATDATNLLTVRPNPYMTPTTLFTTTEFLCEHYGNAFIYIDSEIVMDSKYKGHMSYKGLYPLHPKDVTVWMENKGILKEETNGSPEFYEYRDPH